MLKIKADPYFTAPVAIPVPGQKEPTVIHIKFVHMPAKAAKAYVEDAHERDDVDLLSGIVADWEGVDVPYSRETLTAVLEEYSGASLAIFRTWVRELNGERSKN